MPGFRKTAVCALAAAGTASAVSLSDFVSDKVDLPARCQKVYTTDMDGCEASDFAPGARCAKECLAGIASTQQAVNQNCAGVKVPDDSIIDVFLRDLGAQALCPINPAASGPSSSSAPSSSRPSSSRPQSSATDGSTPPSSSPSATDSPSEIIAAPTPNPQSPSPAPPSPTQTPAIQKSNADSGGGSPFDVQAVGSSPSRRPSLFFVSTSIAGAAIMWLAASL